MAVAFDRQLYRVGKHLVVVEERILQLDTDGCVFLEGERLAVGKNGEFAVHFGCFLKGLCYYTTK